MKSSGPRDSSGASASSPRRAAAGTSDFARPPTPDDLEGCSIVRLAPGAGPDADIRVVVHLDDVLSPAVDPAPVGPAAPAAPRRRLAAPRAGVRPRHWGVERPDVSFPFRVDGDDPRVAGSATGETWRAVFALAAGLSLAVVSYLQFRGARADATAIVAAVAQATSAPSSSDGAPTAQIPDAITDEAEQMPPVDAPSTPSRDRPPSTATAPLGEALTRLAADVIDEMRSIDADAAPAADQPVEARADATSVAEPILQPAVLAEERAAEPAPAVIAAAGVDPVWGDEDHIRAALTRWRTAYSRLDARAAREIWPSVDTRALERAFQALKSQELRFDRCDLTVDGGRAQAACSGRAIYVPRVGNQSPRAVPREWTFELRKLDQRWTIASARAS